MGKNKTQVERDIALRVGARVRQLREIQHVTQIQLATEIGIRAGPLGWIEKGKHLPSGRVLHRLATHLNVRIDDLFQDENVWQESAFPARNQSPVILPPLDDGTHPNAASVKAAHIICQTVAGAVLRLERLCGASSQPQIPLRAAFTPDEAGAEHLAASVRQGLGIGSAVVGDYLDLFESAGIRVVFQEMPEGCTTFSGYDPLNRNAFIFVNSLLKKQPELQTARMVFELGRVFWFTRQQDAAEAETAPAAGADAGAFDEAAFARCFAAHFLMPANAVCSTVWQLGITPEAWPFDLLLRVKARYGVSARCFARRLQSLDLGWSEKQKRNPHYELFKDELKAFHAEHGATAEPGGNRPRVAMNGRLGDMFLLAEQRAGRDQRAVAALKRVLRQSGVRLEA
jgi:DNA-binding XRE family transcriptional regulator/Zn-dependent peptidase ImmA (M78 family)